MGANSYNVHHHAHFPTFTICNSLVCLPTGNQQCTVHMPDMKTGLWLGNFPNILSEIFVLNSTITVCHPLLYHTGCETAEEQDGKVARVMTRVNAYNLPPIFILYILFSSFYINCLFQLHTFCTLGQHSVTINGSKNQNQRCVVQYN